MKRARKTTNPTAIRLAGLALALGLGLSTLPPTPTQADPNRLQVVFIDRADARDVSISAIRFSKAGELTRVDFVLTNTTRRERRFEYKLVWQDAQGAPAQTLTTWRSVILLPRESQTITAVGQQVSADRAQLTIRETVRQPSSRLP
jgi:uncharacterized protein YcfL